MNASQPNPLDENELFDLLVDDELSESQRGELLRRLEQMPDGWRRCALAFLEAQCWKKELGVVAREPQSRVVAAPAPTFPKRAPLFRWGTLLAMAASFLVALGLGFLWREGWQGRTTFPGQVADVLSKPQRPSLAGNPASGASQAPAWQMVTLAADRGQGNDGESIRLPAVERDRIDQDWLRSIPASIPPEVVRAFKNTGHEVHQSRQLVPLPMQDGRRLVVPLDQVDVEYVGRSSY